MESFAMAISLDHPSESILRIYFQNPVPIFDFIIPIADAFGILGQFYEVVDVSADDVDGGIGDIHVAHIVIADGLLDEKADPQYLHIAASLLSSTSKVPPQLVHFAGTIAIYDPLSLFYILYPLISKVL
jgi:hypothetical protein